jgi:hypothetical protein
MYFPEGKRGRELLSRIQFAFARGLMFRLGPTANTNGQPTVALECTLKRYKTNLTSGGLRGFPDRTFFSQCNSDLDRLYIPNAYALSFPAVLPAEAIGHSRTTLSFL